MAGRAMWRAAIEFQKVRVPVKMYAAVRQERVQFHLLHDKDKVRLQQQWVCELENKPVDRADVVRGVPSPLTTLPWVGHRSPRWEPEPARWAGVRGLYALYRTADRLESAGRSSRTSLLARAGDLISGIPH